ncbi:MAG: tRNA pseudouridine(38-40) synthase TruA [Halobacteria archaeon]|nr:tRNA pseudouridine(38-40) synthase TruA [Halobacteria archaeon]
MRIALGIEYDGRPFCGWQYQDHSPSVQAALEQALSSIAAQPIRVICAGRTDTGVHAAEQVVHFDTEVMRDDKAWVRGTNVNLPASVRVLWARNVGDSFHARFCAVRRRYRYVIFNRDVRPAFLAGRVAFDYRPLDEARMQEAAQCLLGEHDFNAYRAVACQAKSPIRTVYRLDVTRRDELILIDIEANAFLHHMVRNIAGVLMTIGAGEQEPVWARQVLQRRDRCLGGVTGPPDGLYLMEVVYPDEFGLPQLPPSSALW